MNRRDGAGKTYQRDRSDELHARAGMQHGQDLVDWIASPTSPLAEDRFTRRPSLEADNGELVLRTRSSSGETEEIDLEAEAAPRSRPPQSSPPVRSHSPRSSVAMKPQASNPGISLVLSSSKRRGAVKPFQSSLHSKPDIDDDTCFASVPLSRELSEPTRTVLDVGSSTSTPRGSTREGTSHVYVRPSRPSTASKSGRESLPSPAMQAPTRPLSTRSRPSSGGRVGSSGDGRSSRFGGALCGSGVGTDIKTMGADMFENLEGEASPDLESPTNRFSRSSESPDSMLESPEDHLCTRGFMDNDARQARLVSEKQELSEVLSEGREVPTRRSDIKYSRSGVQMVQTRKAAGRDRRSSVSPCALRPERSAQRVRSSSPPPQRQTRSSDGSETSPLALGSAPVYRPHPPRNVGRPGDSPVSMVGLRLPPVASASHVSSTLAIDRSPLRSAPQPDRGESGEKFKKAVRAVQKKIKPTGRPSLKKAVRRSPSPENRSPMGSPLGSSSPMASVQKKLAASAGAQGASNSRPGNQRLSSPLVSGGFSRRTNDGMSPVSLARNVSSNSLSSPVIGRHGMGSHGMFDPSRPSLYVCQRERRGTVLSKISDLRGIYRSVSQAIKQAVDGDTIQILSGTYEENIIIETSVYLKPVAGEEVTIRGEGLATVQSSAMSAKIENITLEHNGGDPSLRGQQGARCVEVHEGDFELLNCDVSCAVGSGIMMLDQSYIRVRKSRVNDNGRCGMICFDEARVNCEDSQFKDNGLNGVDVQTASHATLARCQIDRNGQTGVLVSDVDTHVTVMDSSISENSRRGITAQHNGAFTVTGCNIKDNHDIGVLVLGDATPCDCVFVNCNITGNDEGAITIHGCVPDTSSCHIDGTVSLINTPPSRPSPSLPARKFAGASVIQCAWRCHMARHSIRAHVQMYLKRLANEAAAQEEERSLAAAAAAASSSGEASSPQKGAAVQVENPERLEGMEALEADVRDTLHRFDKLNHAMGSLFDEVSNS